MSKETNEGFPLIFQAMINIMRDVEPISKDKQNKQQGFSYRGIDDMYNELHALFAKHGVFPTSEVLNITREERTTKSGTNMIYTIQSIKYTFWAQDGSSVSSVLTGEASDSGDKSTNKSMSVAFKYALMQSLLIPTEELKESDPDAESHETEAKPKQRRNNAAEERKSAESGNNKPTLSTEHKKYSTIIEKLASGESEIDTVLEHFNVSDALKKQMAKDVKAKMKELKAQGGDE